MSSSQCKTCDKIKNYHDDCDSNEEESLYLNLSQSSIIYVPNKTFSEQKVREIERDNALLAEKISYHDSRPKQYKITKDNSLRKISSSEINRRRHQERISRENQMLLKKIQSVKPSKIG